MLFSIEEVSLSGLVVLFFGSGHCLSFRTKASSSLHTHTHFVFVYEILDSKYFVRTGKIINNVYHCASPREFSTTFSLNHSFVITTIVQVVSVSSPDVFFISVHQLF